jgi:cellulose synthase/poly-beta-1,6-N-acetylglucosamine synthase-like glycosyltransferase
VLHVPEANCWTEVPVRWRDLASQRIRWQRGMLESQRDNRQLMFASRYGLIGLVTLPLLWLIDVLGPVSTGLGLLFVPWMVFQGYLPGWHLDLFLITTVGLGILTSLLAVSIECRTGGVYRHPTQIALLACVSLMDNLGYRQLNAWWRLRGLWKHLWRQDGRWVSLTRAGVRAPTGATPPRR